MTLESTRNAGTKGAAMLRFFACGRNWTLERPEDLESLWNALEEDAFQEDERLPYWVELWPSSFALAAWLASHEKTIRGKTCLDLGCGLGFTAMVGTLAGAGVVAMDYEPQALFYARRNAMINRAPQPLWTAMDWRFPAFGQGVFDYVWAGDIMYEKRFVSPVMAFLSRVLAPGGTMWLAEPGRNVYEDFNGALRSGGWTSSRVSREGVTALDGIAVTVNIWEISRVPGFSPGY